MNKIEALEQALAAATPGEWSARRYNQGLFLLADWRHIASWTGSCGDWVKEEDLTPDERQKLSDAHLITLMKNTLPDLLEAVRALEEAHRLLLTMGSTIRYLDEDQDYIEVWTNDGEYIPHPYYEGIAKALAKLRGEVP